MSAVETNSNHAVVATARPEPPDRRLAMGAILSSAACLALMAPFATVPMARVPAFIPAYESALAINDLITAILLYSQFSRVGRISVLVIASGYLFNTLLVIVHALSFPEVFSPTGLLGAGPQTTAWLYVFWHGGFPSFILGYALVAGSRHDLLPDRNRRRRAVAVAIALVMALAAACSVASTLGEPYLPVIVVHGNYIRMVTLGISPAILLLTTAAIAAIWRRRGSTVLDVWLFAVLCGWVGDVSLSAVVSSARFDLGWYGGRLFGLAAASFVLASLLVESNKLYARLADSLAEAEARNAELVRSRSELARVQRLEAIGQLTGGIAHDFNNLLTAILAGLELISRKPEDRDRVIRLADNASKAALRGARLVRQLMTFSRQQDLRPEVLNPNAVLLEFEGLVSRAAGDAVELVFALDEAVDPVRVDATEFQAAVLNLVSNARDAMPNGGVLRIASGNVAIGRDAAGGHASGLAAGHYVLVTVSDTGMGMTAQTQAKAFEPFFTTKPVGSGTGLGLSQVYGFTKSAEGGVLIRSELGKGTAITLYLPRSATGRVSPPAPESAPLPVAEIGQTVLAVEDDPHVTRSTTESLRDLGYTVLTAGNAAEALAALREGRRVDILFSDVMMPGGMNGIALAAAARQLRPGLRVLLTSGYTGAPVQGVPADLPLLRKPYCRADLANGLQAVLQAR